MYKEGWQLHVKTKTAKNYGELNKFNNSFKRTLEK